MEATLGDVVRLCRDCAKQCWDRTAAMVDADASPRPFIAVNRVNFHLEQRRKEEITKCTEVCERVTKVCPTDKQVDAFLGEQERMSQIQTSRPSAISTTGGTQSSVTGGWRGYLAPNPEDKESGYTVDGKDIRKIKQSEMDRCENAAEDFVRYLQLLKDRPIRIEVIGSKNEDNDQAEGLSSKNPQVSAHVPANSPSQMKQHGLMSEKGWESAREFAQQGEGDISGLRITPMAGMAPAEKGGTAPFTDAMGKAVPAAGQTVPFKEVHKQHVTELEKRQKETYESIRGGSSPFGLAAGPAADHPFAQQAPQIHPSQVAHQQEDMERLRTHLQQQQSMMFQHLQELSEKAKAAAEEQQKLGGVPGVGGAMVFDEMTQLRQQSAQLDQQLAEMGIKKM